MVVIIAIWGLFGHYTAHYGNYLDNSLRRPHTCGMAKDIVWLEPLTKEEIDQLPFSKTARAIGGLLRVEPDYTYEEWLAQNIKIELFRQQWKKQPFNTEWKDPFK